MKVKILDRQANQSSYGYMVPQQVYSRSNANVNCTAYPNAANCSGTSNTNTSITPAMSVSYSVTGATFTLLLSDGRLAIVNCASKANWTEWSNNVKRSCRMPIVEDIEVEFSSSSAKLFWPVSVDGKKMESETYKILGILKRP